MGRPEQGCLSSFSSIIVSQILYIRTHHPGWGPKTIWSALKQDKRLATVEIPKPSTIALFLKVKGLVKKYDKNIPLPDSQLYPAKYPHHIWQIDGQGATLIEGLGRVHLINIKDVFSKTYCGSFPNHASLRNGSPSGTNYQHALRAAFCEFGMPSTIQTDHASVFYENKGKSPFPTRFHLWLVSLGIPLIFSRKNTPTDQGIVERAHQTISNQVIKGNSFDSILSLHAYCNKRRKQLNEYLPCSTIGGIPPMKAFPKARYSNRPYSAQSEVQLMDLNRVYQFLAKGKWIRKAGKNKSLHLGGQWYYVKKAQMYSLLHIEFNADKKLLVFRDVNEQLVDRQPIKGISQEILIGESFFEATMPHFQLKLPFNWENHLISTTFLDST